MHTDHYNVARPISRLFICILAFAWPAVCWSESPATQEKAKPKVNLDAGTETDAEGAIAAVEKFLGLWDQRKYEEASALVDEPVRKQFVEQMMKRAIELKSVDDICLVNRNNLLRARVHASVAPSPDRKDLEKQEIGIDMVLRDGKWYVTAR